MSVCPAIVHILILVYIFCRQGPFTRLRTNRDIVYLEAIFLFFLNCLAITFHTTSHTKYVSKEQGESFHLRPFPSRFHSSKQFSSSPFSYWKLLGSPAFQLVKVIGRPVDIQKKWPSSAKSVPDVQKCSLPKPKRKF